MSQHWPPSGQQPPQPYGGYGPQGPYPSAPSGPPPRRSTGPLLAGVAVGVAVAVVVGAVLLLTGAAHWGSSTSAATPAPDTRPITLPDSLAGFRDVQAVMGERSGSSTQAQAQRSRIEHTVARTTEAYQRAFGGAATAVRLYADDRLEVTPTVIAVRAPSPDLLNGPVGDPADLRLAALPQAVSRVGDAECLVVQTQTVVAGKTVDPEKVLTAACHRSGDAASIWVYGNGQGTDGQRQMLALTDAAYAAVTGSS
ncbi:hypothetical protein [Nakamurella endophytica]|uniref:Uncharacterized protein n=1 Tax=Nakamurella endophytica TaxID=1748367 RepID=A0A917T2P4_9ACTN|nr:hypothetical protein [Nakamurella endophytica]GGM06718.1 hypothetical protein GCM10011594_28450 [Nakamurella endophytica]